MNKDNMITVLIIFTMGAFFSFMDWLYARTESEEFTEGETELRIKLQILAKIIISGFIAILAFSYFSHFHEDWGLFFQGTASIAIGAFISQGIIFYARKKVQNA